MREEQAVSPSNPRPLQRNRLLAALSPDDQARLQPQLKSVALELRQELEKPNQPIRYAYFPEEGMASVVAVVDDDTRVEVGIIGCEGMSGVTIVTGNDRSPNATFIQMPGKAQRIAASDLRRAIRESRSLHAVLLKYVQAFMLQTAHTATANGMAPIGTRLARWLLMAHDRAVSDDIPLTHEFLSLMLSVRRAGVTVAVNALARQGLISTARGHITIIDRKAIEAIAGKYYGMPEKELRRLMRERPQSLGRG
jgi:CRP-like cAMP-binding protein